MTETSGTGMQDASTAVRAAEGKGNGHGSHKQRETYWDRLLPVLCSA